MMQMKSVRNREGLIKDEKGSSKEEILIKERKTMSNWFTRLFFSYRILLLLSFIVCILQIFVGISFFDSSSNYSTLPSKSSDPNIFNNTIVNTKSGLRYNCNVTSKETISAINRASSRECKQELVDLACDLDQGTVYPTSLPRSCPRQVDQAIKGKHLGCYQDSFEKRVLQGQLVKLEKTNSPEACVEVCSTFGFSFAGVEWGVECFCGNSRPDNKLLLSSDKCDKSCPGSGEHYCGGYLTINILDTGLKSLVPTKLGLEGTTSVDGDSVRLVYLLTVSGRASRQVTRLVRRIYSPDHYILVHVDVRQEFLYREIIKLSELLPNLRLVKKRFSTIWGGASLLTMLLSAIQELLDMKDWNDWNFVLNLSESDWPIKTQKELVDFLSANRDNNFVKGHGREQEKFIKKQGLDRSFHQCDNHMWRLGTRKLPHGVQIDGGSDWICLNHHFAEYVIRSKDELVSGLKRVFKQTLLPAESFFHTVLRNSEYCTTYIDNNLHLTNWKRKQGCKCQYKAIVDWCGCSPNDFLPEDWNKLEGTKSKQLFFARKFESIIHQGILNSVDSWVHSDAVEGDNQESYWQNVYHHEDSKSQDISVIKVFVSQKLTSLASECRMDLKLSKINEITTYIHQNKYEGTLMYFEATNLQKQAMNIEFKVRYKHNVIKGDESFKSRISHISVGTDFDLKELVFRNFHNLIFQNSQLTLRLECSSGSVENVKIGWLTPMGELVAVSNLQINETNEQSVEYVQPTLVSPLMVGVWTVVVVTERNQLVISEQFLIVSQSQEILPAGHNNVRTDKDIQQLVSINENVPQHFTDLIPLILNYFELLDQCGELDCLLSCSKTTWSSKFPDPKSKIGGIDTQTGELL